MFQSNHMSGVSAASTESKDIERELLLTKGKLNTAQRQMEDLQNRLRNYEDSTSTVPYLEQRIKTLTESLDMKDATIAEMRRLHSQGLDSGQSDLLQKDLSSARNQVDSFHVEKTRLQREVERLRKDVLDRTVQIKNAQDDRDEQVHNMQLDVAQSRRLASELESRLSEMTRGMDALRVERDFLLSQDGKDMMQERIAGLERELQDEQAAHRGTSLKSVQVDEEAGQLRAALSDASERETLKDEAMHSASAKEEHLQSIISNLRSDLDMQKAKAAELSNISGQLQRAQQQLAESGTKLARQGDEMREMGAELEEAREEIAGLRQGLDMSNSKLSTTLTGKQASQEKVESLQAELQAKNQQVARLEGLLDTRSGELERAAAAHQDSAEGVKALQERLNVVSGQLHARNQEFSSLKQDMKAAEDELQRFRQERERTHASLQAIGQEKQALDDDVRSLRETNDNTSTSLSATKNALDDLRSQHERLGAEQRQTLQQLDDSQRKAEELQGRIYELDEQLEVMDKQVQSKDTSLQNMVDARSSLTQQVASAEAETDAVRNERQMMQDQMDETASQLQVSHSRILTLEGRVRELVQATAELDATRERLAARELEIEDVQMRAKELEDEAGRAAILATYLKEKDNSVNETMRRNNNLLADKEMLQRENEGLRLEVHDLQGTAQQRSLRVQDLERNLAQSTEAVDFSEKMLVVSREQTESLEALRRRLKSQEDLVEERDRDLEEFKQQARMENQDLRERLLALTDNNRTLQAQCLNVQTADKSTVQQLRTQVEELRDQLLSAVDQSQSHFILANQYRSRIQHIKTMVVKRLIGQWSYTSASAAFGAWVGVLENQRMDQLQLRPQTSRPTTAIAAPTQSYGTSPFQSRFSQRPNAMHDDALPPRMGVPPPLPPRLDDDNNQRSLSYKAPLSPTYAAPPVQPGYGTLQVTPTGYRRPDTDAAMASIPGHAPPGYQPPPSWSQATYGYDPHSPDAPEIVL